MENSRTWETYPYEQKYNLDPTRVVNVHAKTPWLSSYPFVETLSPLLPTYQSFSNQTISTSLMFGLWNEWIVYFIFVFCQLLKFCILNSIAIYWHNIDLLKEKYVCSLSQLGSLGVIQFISLGNMLVNDNIKVNVNKLSSSYWPLTQQAMTFEPHGGLLSLVGST